MRSLLHSEASWGGRIIGFLVILASFALGAYFFILDSKSMQSNKVPELSRGFLNYAQSINGLDFMLQKQDGRVQANFKFYDRSGALQSAAQRYIDGNIFAIDVIFVQANIGSEHMWIGLPAQLRSINSTQRIQILALYDHDSYPYILEWPAMQTADIKSIKAMFDTAKSAAQINSDGTMTVKKSASKNVRITALFITEQESHKWRKISCNFDATLSLGTSTQ